MGRLDYDTRTLILSNDGELTYKITHPKHNIKPIEPNPRKGEKDDIAEKGIAIEDCYCPCKNGSSKIL